jgi:nitroreductase
MTLKAILNRRSIRDFMPDNVSDDKILEIIKAGQFAPSAMGNRAVKYLVITKKETKKALYEIVGQNFVKEAPVLILPYLDKGASPEPLADLSVCSATMMIEAVNQGLGSVWKNIHQNFSTNVAKILDLSADAYFTHLLAIGKPKNTPILHGESEIKLDIIRFI